MADAFDVVLPTPGQKPWNLNPAIEEIRGRVGDAETRTVELSEAVDTNTEGIYQLNTSVSGVEHVLDAGRLSPKSLESSSLRSSALAPSTLARESETYFEGGQWGSYGAVTGDAVVLTASPGSNVSGGVLSINPAYTQELPNADFSGATPGVIGSGGASPTGWGRHQTSAGATIETGTGDGSFVFTTGFDGVSGTGYFTANDLAVTEEMILTFTAGVICTDASKQASLVVAWRNTATGVLDFIAGGGVNQTPATSYDPGSHRVSVVIPVPAAPSRLTFWVRGDTGVSYTGVSATVTLREVVLVKRATLGSSKLALLPTRRTTQPSRNTTLRLPPGNYYLLGVSPIAPAIGIPFRNEGTTITVGAILGGGCYQFSRFYIIRPERYKSEYLANTLSPRWVSPVYTQLGATLNRTSPALTSMVLDRPLDLVGRYTSAANGRWAAQVAANIFNAVRFEVRAGDIGPGDIGTTKERAEMTTNQTFDYGVPFSWGAWVKVDQLDPTVGPRIIIISQCRYVTTPDPGSNPEFTMGMYRNTDPNLWGLQFRYLTTPRAVADAAPPSGTTWPIWTFPLGEWVYISYRVTLGASGRVEAWVNRTGAPAAHEKIVDYTGTLGYTDIDRFRPLFGIYDGGASGADTPRRNAFQCVQFGPGVNAEELAAFPPPRMVA